MKTTSMEAKSIEVVYYMERLYEFKKTTAKRYC